MLLQRKSVFGVIFPGKKDSERETAGNPARGRRYGMGIRQKVSQYYRCGLTLISPKWNTMYNYRKRFGKKLDFNHPRTLNEKVLWLKFHDYWNNPLIKQCADKYRVREYIESAGCGEILNELIAVYDSADEIRWDALPESFVLKLNVGCGYNIIVPDQSKLDREEAKRKLQTWMNTKYYLDYSEMQYKGVKPVILAERYLKPKNGLLPEDYKFYCYDGYVPYVMVCTDRQEGGKDPHYWYFNENWEMQMLSKDALEYGSSASVPKPDGIDRAFEYARILSRGFPFVRVDLYIVDGKVYFGELTFTPSGGLDNERLPETDGILGSFVKRP